MFLNPESRNTASAFDPVFYDYGNLGAFVPKKRKKKVKPISPVARMVGSIFHSDGKFSAPHFLMANVQYCSKWRQKCNCIRRGEIIRCHTVSEKYAL